MRLNRSWMPVAIGCLVAAAWLAPGRAAPSAEDEYFVYVGSYTDAPSSSKGIYAWRFSAGSGAAAPLGLVAETVNPAYVHATPDAKFLFATNWQTANAANADTVSAYAIDRKTGALTPLDNANAGGGLPNQVVVDPRGTIAAVTNYGFRTTDPDRNNSSFAVLRVRPDGRLDGPIYADHHTGPALSPRQTSGAHTHGVVFTKDDRFAFVAELGLDRVYTYRIDAAKPAVTASTPPFVSVSAGSGPRRLVLSPNDKFLYVNHETDSKVSVFSVDEGRLAEIQQISTLPAAFTGRNTTAEIQIDKAGRFLYVSNRGADTVAMYAVDPSKGTLTLREFFSAQGHTPRNITIDPSGRYLFASNQSSNNVVVFAIDAATGRLRSTGTELKLDQPASVFFVKAAGAPAPRQVTWTFDRLDAIGGAKTTVEGHPKVIDSPVGKAVEFDGVGDSLLVEQHPLAGAETFTFEAIFRPDGGANQQRWFHLAEIDPKTGLATSAEKTTSESNSRFLFEIRVVNDNQWYLDAFVNGPGYSKALMFADKRHPVGRWYHVAQVYDGKSYRSYVNGELQGEAELAFTPQGPGRASIGVRMNKVNYFHGAVAVARFTQAALPVSEFLTVPGNWATYGGSHTSQRYSQLKQVTTANASRLEAKWVYHLDGVQELELTPIVMNGVMYISAFNRLDAVDARTGNIIWKYQRQPPSTARQRGTAVFGDKVYVVTSDSHLVALDVRTGGVRWDVKSDGGFTISGGAPLVADGKVVVSGNRPHGFIQAYDADTGKYLWTWSAVPTRPDDPAYATWGGGTPAGAPIWVSGSYDPELNLLYYGTGQPDPQWTGVARPGDNLYSDSIVALDVKTGTLKWHFQNTPHDTHDWDSLESPVLVDAAFRGRPRKLLLQANRNGFYYVLDRTTGEFLLGTPFVDKLDWATGLDAKGRPIVAPGHEPTVKGTTTCPSTAGATNWPPPTYSPDTQYFYVVVAEGCGINVITSTAPDSGTGYYETPVAPWQAYVRAIDAFTGKRVWEYKAVRSNHYGPGLLSTAGGIVFAPEQFGQVSVLDAKSGKSLWHFNTGDIITAAPATYSVDGQQFFAVASGTNVFAFGLFDTQQETAR